jgi:dolichol-phosphate mannosyltransferase
MLSVSLILPFASGRVHPTLKLSEFRAILAREGHFESVEIVIATWSGNDPRGENLSDWRFDEGHGDLARHIVAGEPEWSSLARAGLCAASGDVLIVLDVDRDYAPESLLDVIAPLLSERCELAVAVPDPRRSLWHWFRSRFGFGLVSQIFLGTSDAFAGLFALRRSFWDQHVGNERLSRYSAILELLSRRRARAIDVPVQVGGGFRPQGLGFRDVRPLKHLLDARFGNYSRLVQFCMVGASGMVIDLSSYALLQWLLAFTWLVSQSSALFGVPWHLVIARALSIAVALVWNFAFNRRLTFNDARKGALLRQFSTYVLSNAVAIAVSFSLSLYLPANLAFFARHKLAAAVVGIVAATGISFSMSRWLVFARRPESSRAAYLPVEEPAV